MTSTSKLYAVAIISISSMLGQSERVTPAMGGMNAPQQNEATTASIKCVCASTSATSASTLTISTTARMRSVTGPYPLSTNLPNTGAKHAMPIVNPAVQRPAMVAPYRALTKSTSTMVTTPTGKRASTMESASCGTCFVWKNAR